MVPRRAKVLGPQFFPHGAVGESYVATFLRNLFDKIAFEVALELKPKWGHLPHWTLAHDHAMKVQWDPFLNYRYKDEPEIRPSFEPIAPGRYIGNADRSKDATSDVTGFSENAE